MAIFSLNHRTIGRSTHRAGTAAAYARYILRRRAAGAVLSEHMPDGSKAAQRWLLDQEEGDRKNARVIDKIMVVLPIELHPLQRQKLLREFCERITDHRIPWLAAIHDKGKDASNPHAHVIIRDRDIQTGRRFAQLSEKGSTDRLRKLWAETANEALERAGQKSRIDHGRKKDGKPGRHRGPTFRSPPSEVPKGALRTCAKSCASVAAAKSRKGALTTRNSFESVRGGIGPLDHGNPAPADRRSHHPQAIGAPGPPRPG